MQYRGLDLSANVSILFPELDYLDRFAAARDAGFDAVESWWPFAEAVPEPARVDAVLAAIAAAGVQLTGLNFWAGDMPAGQRGMAVHAVRHVELQANVRLVAEIAATTGCRQFNLLYGQLDGGLTAAEGAKAAAVAYREAADAVAPLGGTVLIEPLARGLNGEYPLHTAGDALAFVDRELDGDTRVRLLFDTFHLGHNGDDVVAAAREHAARIGHVQIADDPGRGEPGTGALPIDACLDALTAAGYAGRVGVEYKPTRDPGTTFSWIAGS